MTTSTTDRATPADGSNPPGSDEPEVPRREPAAETGPPRGQAVMATVLAATTVLAAAGALGSVINGNEWWIPAVLAVATVTVVAIVGISVRWPRLVIGLTQLAALAALLWVLYPPEDYGGYAELIAVARSHIVVSVPPAPWISVLGFVIAGFLGLLTILATQLVSVPTLVAIPALVVFVTGSTFAERALPWPVFAAAGGCYVALLLVTAPRPPSRETHGAAKAGAATAAALAVGLSVVGLAYLGQSRVTSVATWGLLERTGYEGPAMFTSLTGDLLRGPEMDLLQISSPYRAGYLRTSALEVWQPGVGWSLGPVSPSQPERSNAPLFDVEITSLGYEGQFLPVAQGTTSVTSPDAWTRDANLNAWYRAGVTNPGTYTISIYSPSSIDVLQQDTVTPGELTETGELDPMVADLAASVVAGRASPFERAVALRDFFVNPVNGFVYSLYLPRGESGDPLVDFLTNRTGYCQQYASTMAIMLRTLGIPSRVVVGFGPGERQDDGTYLVTSHDAHSWVEARFDSWGWFPFDPTPPAGSPARTRPADPTATPEATEAAPEAAPEDALVPDAAAPSAAASAPTATAPATTAPDTEAETEPARNPWPLLGWVAGAGGIILAPWLWRRARRGLRVRAIAADRPGAAEKAWAEMRDLAVDYRVRLRSGASLREDAEVMATRAHLSAPARRTLGEVVEALERSWYAPAGAGGRSATAGRSPEPAPDPAGGARVALIHEVRTGLAKHRARTYADRLFPRSLRPGSHR